MLILLIADVGREVMRLTRQADGGRRKRRRARRRRGDAGTASGDVDAAGAGECVLGIRCLEEDACSLAAVACIPVADSF